MERQKTARIVWIDYLKAFAIFLVILGHSIQNISTCVELGRVYSFIYSFHMPLFMTISGFFLGKMLHDSPAHFLLKRARQLLLPVLSFSVLAFAVSWMTPFDMTMGLGFMDYLFGGDMWFLKYLFACSVIAYVSKAVFRSTCFSAILLPALLVTLSRVGIFRLLPFLWLGHYIHRYSESMERKTRQLLPICMLSFAVMLFFWQMEYDAPNFRIASFKEGFTFSLSSLAVILYRFAIGAVGSLTFILLFCKFGKCLEVGKGMRESLSRFLLVSGRRTLGIYCLQIYLLEHLAENITLPVLCDTCNVILVFAVAVLEFVVCSIIVGLLERNRYTRLLFLGQ